jgi:hypothetical protein
MGRRHGEDGTNEPQCAQRNKCPALLTARQECKLDQVLLRGQEHMLLRCCTLALCLLLRLSLSSPSSLSFTLSPLSAPLILSKGESLAVAHFLLNESQGSHMRLATSTPTSHQSEHITRDICFRHPNETLRPPPSMSLSHAPSGSHAVACIQYTKVCWARTPGYQIFSKDAVL